MRRAPPLGCSYVFVATKGYFSALAVMLHSLQRARDDRAEDCDSMLLLWHPEHADTVLSRAQRALLTFLAAPSYTIRFKRVDDARFRVWRRIPGRFAAA